MCTFEYLYQFLIRFVCDCVYGEYSVLLHHPGSLSPPLFTCYVAIVTPHLGKIIGQPEEGIATGEGVQVRGREEERQRNRGTRQR